MNKTTLQLTQDAYPTCDGNTYEASAKDIKSDDMYMVYWEITPYGKNYVKQAWEELTTVDESEMCDWSKIHMIKLNGREQNTEDFEIVE